MLRSIIFIALCLVLYYAIKTCLKGYKRPKLGSRQAGKRSGGPFGPPPPITDELVQDPVCGVYCPKRDAITLIWKGKVYHFCSEKCRKAFQERIKKS